MHRAPARLSFDTIFSGDGQLWGIGGDPLTTRRPLVRVDPSTGRIATGRTVERCPYPSGVVGLGKLWLLCHGLLTAYDPKDGAENPVRVPRSSIVLASSRGVWVVTRSLIGIAGDAAGRRIDLGPAQKGVLWKADGSEVWALDLGTADKQALFRIDLSSGAVRRFALETSGGEIDDFALTSREVWATLSGRPEILRFRRRDPRLRLPSVDVSGFAHSKDAQVFLTPGRSCMWIGVFSNRQYRLLCGRVSE
jgi:hypothetical protein